MRLWFGSCVVVIILAAMSKYLLLACAVLMGCGAAKKDRSVVPTFYSAPVDQVLGHLNLVGAASCLYVTSDSLHYLAALQAYGLPIDLATTAAQRQLFNDAPELAALPVNWVLWSEAGLRTEQTYARILVDRSQVPLNAEAQIALVGMLTKHLDDPGILVFLSPKQAQNTDQVLQKANLELQATAAYRKSAIDTSLSPSVQALILVK